MTPTLLESVDDGALTLRLNRPEKLNALDAATADALVDALNRASTDGAVRCVVITGTGRGFCVGADTGSDLPVAELLDDAAVSTTDNSVPTTGGAVPMLDRANAIATAVAGVSVPVVAGVNGVTVGLGLSLAFACDIVVMASSAKAKLGFSSIGLVPDGGASLTVRDRLGFRRAMGMAVLGDALDARTALDLGLVNRVFDDATFGDELANLARAIADGPTRAFEGTKSALTQQYRRELPGALVHESITQLDLIQTISSQTPSTG